MINHPKNSLCLNGVSMYTRDGQTVLQTLRGSYKESSATTEKKRRSAVIYVIYNILRDAAQVGFYEAGRKGKYHKYFFSLNLQIQKSVGWDETLEFDYSLLRLTDGSMGFSCVRSLNELRWSERDLPYGFTLEGTILHAVLINPAEKLSTYGRARYVDGCLTMDFSHVASQGVVLWLSYFITDGERRSKNENVHLSVSEVELILRGSLHTNDDPQQHVIVPESHSRSHMRKTLSASELPKTCQWRGRGAFEYSAKEPWKRLKRGTLKSLGIAGTPLSSATYSSEISNGGLLSEREGVRSWGGLVSTLESELSQDRVSECLRKRANREAARTGWPSECMLDCLELLSVPGLSSLRARAQGMRRKPLVELEELLRSSLEVRPSEMDEEKLALRGEILLTVGHEIHLRSQKQARAYAGSWFSYVDCPARLGGGRGMLGSSASESEVSGVADVSVSQ